MCELVGLFILNDLGNEYGKDNIGLYRDEGLAIFKHTSGPQAERIRKDITRRFKTHGLNITIQTNMKIVNYLDVTFDLTNGTYCPYRKPNDHPQYINTKSNHPPNIIKQIPASINRRISDNSSNEDAFNKAKPVYNSALKASSYTETPEASIFSASREERTGKDRKRKNPETGSAHCSVQYYYKYLHCYSNNYYYCPYHYCVYYFHQYCLHNFQP